jgi:hypothetical protein
MSHDREEGQDYYKDTDIGLSKKDIKRQDAIFKVIVWVTGIVLFLFLFLANLPKFAR